MERPAAMSMVDWFRTNVLLAVTLCLVTLVWVCGLYLVVSGLLLMTTFGQYDAMFNDALVNFPLLGIPVVFFGLVVCLVANCACFAALSRNTFLTSAFVATLWVFALAEFGLTLVFFVSTKVVDKTNYTDTVYERIRDNMEGSFQNEYNILVLNHTSVPPDEPILHDGKNTREDQDSPVIHQYLFHPTVEGPIYLDPPEDEYPVVPDDPDSPIPGDPNFPAAPGEVVDAINPDILADPNFPHIPRPPLDKRYPMNSLQFDALQYFFVCCGVNGSKDFTSRLLALPASCCHALEGGATCNETHAHAQGCKDAFTFWVHDRMTSFTITALVFCVITVAAAISASTLSQGVNVMENEYGPERRSEKSPILVWIDEYIMRSITLMLLVCVWLCGAYLAAKGILLIASFSEYDNVLTLNQGWTFGLLGVPILLGGVVICLVACCGCFSAIWGTLGLLVTFMVIMWVLAVVEFGLSVTMFVGLKSEEKRYPGGVLDRLDEKLDAAFDSQYYEVEANNTNSTHWQMVSKDSDDCCKLDVCHKFFSCCGVNGTEDFHERHLALPPSCCGDLRTECTSAHAYTRGCRNASYAWVHNTLASSATRSAVFCVLMVATAISACALVAMEILYDDDDDYD